jgi:hypothetical protein
MCTACSTQGEKYKLKKSKATPVIRLGGLKSFETQTFSRQSAPKWQLGCQPYPPAALYPHKDLLVLISVRG